jgi:hypothetical protein
LPRRKLPEAALIFQPLFTLSFDVRQSFVYLLLRKGLATFRALVDLLCELVVNQLIGEVDAVEADRKVVNPLKVPILAVITEKIVSNGIHLLFPRCLEPLKRLWGFCIVSPFF